MEQSAIQKSINIPSELETFYSTDPQNLPCESEQPPNFQVAKTAGYCDKLLVYFGNRITEMQVMTSYRSQVAQDNKSKSEKINSFINKYQLKWSDVKSLLIEIEIAMSNIFRIINEFRKSHATIEFSVDSYQNELQTIAEKIKQSAFMLQDLSNLSDQISELEIKVIEGKNAGDKLSTLILAHDDLEQDKAKNKKKFEEQQASLQQQQQKINTSDNQISVLQSTATQLNKEIYNYTELINLISIKVQDINSQQIANIAQSNQENNQTLDHYISVLKQEIIYMTERYNKVKLKLEDLEFQIAEFDDMVEPTTHFIIAIDQNSSLVQKRGYGITYPNIDIIYRYYDIVFELMKRNEQTKHKISIIAFHKDAQVIIEFEDMIFEKEKILQTAKIFDHHPETNMSNAIDIISQLIKKNPNMNTIGLILSNGKIKDESDTFSAASKLILIKNQFTKSFFLFTWGIGQLSCKQFLIQLVLRVNGFSTSRRITDKHFEFVLEDNRNYLESNLLFLTQLQPLRYQALLNKKTKLKDLLENTSEMRNKILKQVQEEAEFDENLLDQIQNLHNETMMQSLQKKIEKLNSQLQDFQTIKTEKQIYLKKIQDEIENETKHQKCKEDLQILKTEVEDSRKWLQNNQIKLNELQNQINQEKDRLLLNNFDPQNQELLAIETKILISEFGNLKIKIRESYNFAGQLFNSASQLQYMIQQMEKQKNCYNYQTASMVLVMNIQQAENKPLSDLKELIKNKLDLDESEKVLELFDKMFKLDTDKEHFRSILKVLHLKDILLLDDKQIDNSKALEQVKENIKLIFQKELNNIGNQVSRAQKDKIEEENQLKTVKEEIKEYFEHYEEIRKQYEEEEMINTTYDYKFKQAKRNYDKVLKDIDNLQNEIQEYNDQLQVVNSNDQIEDPKQKKRQTDKIKDYIKELEEDLEEKVIKRDKVEKEYQKLSIPKFSKIKDQWEEVQKMMRELNEKEKSIKEKIKKLDSDLKEKDSLFQTKTIELNDQLLCIGNMLTRIRTGIIEQMTKFNHMKMVHHIDTVIVPYVNSSILDPIRQMKQAQSYGMSEMQNILQICD